MKQHLCSSLALYRAATGFPRSQQEIGQIELWTARDWICYRRWPGTEDPARPVRRMPSPCWRGTVLAGIGMLQGHDVKGSRGVARRTFGCLSYGGRRPPGYPREPRPWDGLSFRSVLDSRETHRCNLPVRKGIRWRP